MMMPQTKIFGQLTPAHSFSGQRIIASFSKNGFVQGKKFNRSAGNFGIAIEGSSGQAVSTAEICVWSFNRLSYPRSS